MSIEFELERANPIFAEQNALAPHWTTIESMPTVSRYGADDASVAQVLGIADLSALLRCGFKGPSTAAWLSEQRLPIPPQPNAWLPLASGGLIARLGRMEFLIEDSVGAGECARVASQTRTAGVYFVLRQDVELALIGRRTADLLLQTCSVDFSSLELATRPTVVTSMAGIAVTVVPQWTAGEVRYRIWCDSTYGGYLWETLVKVARELGGGPIGLEALGDLVHGRDTLAE
jgi:sarcosine oxidase subunit gamma